MGKYSKKQAARAQTISTLGGDYALKWDDETQMSVNAHVTDLDMDARDVLPLYRERGDIRPRRRRRVA